MSLKVRSPRQPQDHGLVQYGLVGLVSVEDSTEQVLCVCVCVCVCGGGGGER